MTNNRSNFTSKIGFILAAAGSAVGLGNIWRFRIWSHSTAAEHFCSATSYLR